MTEQLSPTERQVVDAMKANPDGLAAFDRRPASRRVAILSAWDGGIIIRARNNPQRALRRRGLIAPVKRDVAGVWFQLTEKGRAA